MILFKVNLKNDDRCAFIMAQSRESAKSRGAKFIGGDPDQYEVTPLTNPGETFWLETVFSE